MENNKIFADGLIYKAPRENAPEFVKGSLSVKVDEFKQLLDKHNNNGWVNLDMLKSKNGNIYMTVNTWKPQSSASPAERMQQGMNSTAEIPEEMKKIIVDDQVTPITDEQVDNFNPSNSHFSASKIPF